MFLFIFVLSDDLVRLLANLGPNGSRLYEVLKTNILQQATCFYLAAMEIIFAKIKGIFWDLPTQGKAFGSKTENSMQIFMNKVQGQSLT